MVRKGGPSRGCRVCRQRRIKCDEASPACVQCTSSGRQCPGPITSVFIRDMTSKAGHHFLAKPGIDQPQSSAKTSSEAGAAFGRQHAYSHVMKDFNSVETHSVSHESALHGSTQTSTVPFTKQTLTPLMEVELVGTAQDPFMTLPVDLRSCTQRLLHRYKEMMGPALIPFGPIDSLCDVWLPFILSDQLLLQSTLFYTSVYLSALHPPASHEIARYKGEALSLLNRRLADPRHAVTDVTIATVLLFIHQSIVSGNEAHTRTHMDGLEKMLKIRGSRSNPEVQEILFWTDLIGSAFTHTPMRKYSPRPNTPINLHCLPVFLDPRTGIASLCIGFQPLLIDPTFEALINPLHELRCLTLAFYFSSCKAHVELPIFAQMCIEVTRRLHALSHKDTSPVFSACIFASILFVNLVLLPTTINLLPLAGELQLTMGPISFKETPPQIRRVLLWMFFIGSAATSETGLGTWYAEHFRNELITLGLRSAQAVKKILAEFFWIDEPCDILLITVLKKQMSMVSTTHKT